jgi:squalene synthase HpnD
MVAMTAETADDAPPSQRGRSSFYWAMRLMPPERREAMFAIYDIARALDDVADDPGDAAGKRTALDAWRQEIAALYAGKPTRALTRAVWPAVQRFQLPRNEFEELIRGMEMDVDGPIQGPTRAALDVYCRRVAGAVGMLSLPVFGADGPDEREFGLHLGRALQLTNILRDMAEDAGIGRLYLPREYLQAAGIATVEPAAVLRDPRLPAVTKAVGADAERAFAATDEILPLCNRRALWPALAMKAAYRRMLDRMRATGFSPDIPARPSKRAALTAALCARFLGKA